MRLFVKKDTGILGDRVFAFTRTIDKKMSELYECDPSIRELKYFLNLKNSPFLNKYNFALENNELHVFLGEVLIDKIDVYSSKSKEKFCKNFASIEPGIKNFPYLINNSNHPFFDTMPSNSVSLINLNSIKDFELKSSLTISYKRFRGNIYVSDLDPWDEFRWINKEILINKCLFKVTNKIQRCSATNLVPKTDKKDINIPMKLKEIYNHAFMGVYLTPLSDGQIQLGDKIVLVSSN
jgi:hypothetical protein